MPGTAIWRLVKGEKIELAYKHAIGYSSCMTGSSAEYTRIYTENPEKVSMLILEPKVARALVWQTEEGNILLDRIYPNSGQHIEKFNHYAETQGWLIRENNYAIHKNVKFGSKQKYHIKLHKPNNDYYPYMDSFKFAKFACDHQIVLSNILTDEYFHLFSTEGDIPEILVCRRCGSNITENDHINLSGDSYCSECTFICTRCGEYETIDESIEIYDDLYCSHCIENYFGRCSNCEGYYNLDDLTSINDELYCENCKMELFVKCKCCKEFIKIDETINIYNFNYCQDCADENFERCTNCKEYYETNNLTIINKDSYCDYCISILFKQCSDCNEFILKEKICHCEKFNVAS